MEDVFVTGTGMTRFGKQLDQSLPDLVATAISVALEEAGKRPGDIDEIFFANAIGASITGQEMVLGQVAARAAGFDSLPIFNVENACASGSTALHLGSRSVASGAAGCVLCVGAEKMTDTNRARALVALGRAPDVAAVFGPAGPPPGGRSWFMDHYAAEAKSYMEREGAEVEDFAAVAVKNHGNGALNPLAQYGGRMSVAEVIDGREIVWPLTLSMCSPVSDGAAAVVLETAPADLAIRVSGSAIRSGSGSAEGPNASRRAVAAAYEQAGLGPEDLDVVELHDATAPAEVELYEALDLAPAGGGVAMVRDRATDLGGRLPVNPSGGLLAKGHPVAATGLAQVVEISAHLRGRAGDRQVTGARVGLTHNAGGWIGEDNAVAAVHILERL